MAQKLGLSRLVRRVFSPDSWHPPPAPLRDARDALGATRAARTHVAAVVRGLVTVGDDALAGSTSHADESQRMPTKPSLGFVGGHAVHEGPGGGCPFPQHVYDAVAAALAQGISVEQMQVDLPALAGMSRRAVLQLAKKVEAGGRVPGRHGVHAITREVLRHLHLLVGRRLLDGRQASPDLLVQRRRHTASRGRRREVVLVEELEGVPAVVGLGFRV